MSSGEGTEVAPLSKQPWHKRLLVKVLPDSLAKLVLTDSAVDRDQFSELLGSAEDILSNLQQDIETVIDEDCFLTSTERATLVESVNTLRQELRQVRSSVWLFSLTEEESERLETLRSDSQTAIKRIATHNERFVKGQIDACEHLFRDIDDEGTDLTDEQCRAIVRNDDTNQVIAGAGSGKTLVLSHRIAYLIERGVDPDHIAAITLTNNATEEIERRLKDRFDITGVDVNTIHAFANAIAQEAAADYITTIDQEAKENYIEDELRSAIEKPDNTLAYHYRRFLTLYNTSPPVPDDFESRQEYIAARADRSYETLAGETVASQAEKVIADLLFTNGVAYQYEAIADWAQTASDKRAYQPDFYLPNHDCYIEHWGVDEAGEIAPWFSWSSEEYREKLLWARQQFQQAEYELINTYDFEQQTGRLERVLTHRLQVHGIPLDPISTEELVSHVVPEHEQEQKVISEFVNFVDAARTFDVSPQEAKRRLPVDNPRLRHFGESGAILLDRYESWLANHSYQDFSGMLYNAIDAIETSPDRFAEKYDHILVDEFQDVAIGQIRLLQTLSDSNDDTRLFCVGDDWQSIYAFRGAVVEYFVDFDDYFGPSTQTILTQNFRCPPDIVEASTELIRHNPNQVPKEVKAATSGGTQPRVHTVNGYNDWKYAEQIGERAADLIEQYLADGSNPQNVMVLSRYDAGASYTDRLKTALEEREIPYDGKRDTDTYRPSGRADSHQSGDNAGVSVFSAHQAKGREAAHVILLHATADYAGFSPQTRDDELVDIVRDVPASTAAEERRLFYVALTRATESLDILSRADEQSAFLSEISEYVTEVQSVANPGQVGDRITLTATVDRLWEDTHTKKAQAGVLKDSSGTAKFVAWDSVSPPTVSEGIQYEFTDLEVSEYNGDTELHFTNSTQINRVDTQTVLSELE